MPGALASRGRPGPLHGYCQQSAASRRRRPGPARERDCARPLPESRGRPGGSVGGGGGGATQPPGIRVAGDEWNGRQDGAQDYRAARAGDRAAAAGADDGRGRVLERAVLAGAGIGTDRACSLHGRASRRNAALAGRLGARGVSHVQPPPEAEADLGQLGNRGTGPAGAHARMCGRRGQRGVDRSRVDRADWGRADHDHRTGRSGGAQP